ncbi:prepilin-type N-terminal cleavage/methylation domain-containing protein [Sphingosinicella terrae]|uniref:prepilin-type N-terminal cleavage/methylation domain-containing protein n=1 Tax=Sphingosinicella terrae TaxID=2172047 RepID=UPI0013B397B2|nr:prepilin-type N-terminal cleavage/methylation domain-containing protein [Sphingosinicella terrae]
MPTSRWASKQAGFTLMEMLVVLVILGLAAALIAGRLAGRPGRIDRERTVTALQARIAAARRDAMRSGAAVRLVPAEVDAAAALTDPVFGREMALVFHPDGSSNGGTVLLAGRPALSVDWLSGATADAP